LKKANSKWNNYYNSSDNNIEETHNNTDIYE